MTWLGGRQTKTSCIMRNEFNESQEDRELDQHHAARYETITVIWEISATACFRQRRYALAVLTDRHDGRTFLTTVWTDRRDGWSVRTSRRDGPSCWKALHDNVFFRQSVVTVVQYALPLSLSLWHCHCHYDTVTVTVTMTLSLSLWHCHCHYDTVTVAMTLSLSLWHCHCFYDTVTVTVTMTLSLSLWHCRCYCYCHRHRQLSLSRLSAQRFAIARLWYSPGKHKVSFH